jgi:hypothetical protein
MGTNEPVRLTELSGSSSPACFPTLRIHRPSFKMAIVVRKVSDDDLPRAIEVETAAYADNPLSPLLFPGPFPPDASVNRVPDLIEMRNSDPTINFLQAYDEETGQLVAFAKWSVYKTNEEAATSDRPMRSFGAGTNREGCEAFFGMLKSKKKELMGHKPHLCKYTRLSFFLGAVPFHQLPSHVQSLYALALSLYTKHAAT